MFANINSNWTVNFNWMLMFRTKHPHCLLSRFQSFLIQHVELGSKIQPAKERSWVVLQSMELTDGRCCTLKQTRLPLGNFSSLVRFFYTDHFLVMHVMETKTLQPLSTQQNTMYSALFMCNVLNQVPCFVQLYVCKDINMHKISLSKLMFIITPAGPNMSYRGIEMGIITRRSKVFLKYNLKGFNSLYLRGDAAQWNQKEKS